MKTIHNTKIIGIDHGYGNMKTANFCFPTGITAYDHEPLFTADMLVYGGRYYLIGEGHKEFAPDKIKDEDYYVLTLAAIAKVPLSMECRRVHSNSMSAVSAAHPKEDTSSFPSVLSGLQI